MSGLLCFCQSKELGQHESSLTDLYWDKGPVLLVIIGGWPWAFTLSIKLDRYHKAMSKIKNGNIAGKAMADAPHSSCTCNLKCQALTITLKGISSVFG